MRVFLQAAGDLFLTSLFLTEKKTTFHVLYRWLSYLASSSLRKELISDKRANVYNRRQIGMIKLTSRGQFWTCDFQKDTGHVIMLYLSESWAQQQIMYTFNSRLSAELGGAGNADSPHSSQKWTVHSII